MRIPTKHRTFWILQILVFGCLSFPHALHSQEPENTRKRIGLALSGGGARGAAHIGVLKVLEREGIKIDCIAGASFGSIIAGLYATGYSAGEIETLLMNHWQEVFSNQAVRARAPLIQNRRARYLIRLDMEGFTPSLPMGILRGQNLFELISQQTLESMLAADYDFDQLPIPFRAVATNLLTGESYVFKSGRISEAIYDSMAQPAYFSPVVRDGMILVDGGLVDNLPAKIVAEEMGADVVIAVDTSSPEPRHEDVSNFLNVIEQSISIGVRSTIKPSYRYAQLVIRPDLDGYSSNDYDQMTEIIKVGISATDSMMGEIRKLVGKANLAEPPKTRPAVINPIIESITFKTTPDSESQNITSSFLLRQVKSRPGDKIIAESLNADIESLYATGMFERVDYECRHVKDKSYNLVYHLTESSPNSLGLSLRYDREYNMQALVEFTAGNLFGTTSYGLLSVRFGETAHKTASLRLIHPKLPALFIEPQAQILTNERFEYITPQDMLTFQDKRWGTQVMLGTTLLNRFEVAAGYRFETEKFVPKGERHDNKPSTNLRGLRLRLRLDTLDQQEFPDSGMRIEIKGDLKTRKIGADLSYSIVQGEIRRYFSLTDKTTFTARLAGFKSGGTLPDFERAYLGGYGFSDTASYRFLGYKRDEFAVPNMVIAGVGCRRQLFMRPLGFIVSGYLSAEYNLAGMQSTAADREAFNRVVHGGAIGLDFDTMIGPMRMALGIGNAGKLRLYLSVGLSF